MVSHRRAWSGFISIFFCIFLTFLSSTAFCQTLIGADYTSDTVLTAANSPYQLTVSVYVYNCTLTIEAGVQINLNGKTLNVGKSSHAGQVNADGAVFTNSLTSNGNIVFNYASAGSLNSCVFDNVCMNIYTGSPTVSGCTFKNVVNPIIFKNMGANPILSGNTFTDITNTSIALASGFDFTENGTLKKYEIGYLLTSDVSIYISTLTVEPGITINMSSYSFSLGTTNKPGYLNAQDATFISTYIGQ